MLPLGADGQGIDAQQGIVAPLAVDQPVAVNGADVVHRLRIVDADRGLHRQQPFDQHQGGRFADVVGAGLERQSPDGNRLVGELAAEVPLDLSDRARSFADR